MFRIIIHKLPRVSDSIVYRVRVKNRTPVKLLRIQHGIITTDEKNKASEKFASACNKITIDCLYQIYGDDWYKYHNIDQLMKSIISAVKRMK